MGQHIWFITKVYYAFLPLSIDPLQGRPNQPGRATLFIYPFFSYFEVIVMKHVKTERGS